MKTHKLKWFLGSYGLLLIPFLVHGIFAGKYWAESLKYFLQFYYLLYFMCGVVITMVYVLAKKLKDKLGYIFMGLMLAKMAISAAYLFPIIKDVEDPKMLVGHFMILYISSLLIELLVIVKLLNKQSLSSE